MAIEKFVGLKRIMRQKNALFADFAKKDEKNSKKDVIVHLRAPKAPRIPNFLTQKG